MKVKEDRKITSTDIKIALAEKHYKEFFATEVKNGPTYDPPAQGLLKFDALAIYKSWSAPKIVVYEIKVSRSDFLQDGKWHLYKQYCHEIYFVVPDRMVKKEELPDDTGLMYYNPETGAIRTVKKPLYRRHIGSELRTKMAQQMEQLTAEIARYKNAGEDLELLNKIMEVMRKHGIHTWRHNGLAARLDKALSKTFPVDTSLLVSELESVLERIKEIQNRQQETTPEAPDDG